MKSSYRPLAFLAFICSALLGQAQGTFQNFNFEAADPSGYSPNSSLPAASGFPDWVVSYSSPGVGTNTPMTVWYDGISIGGALVSIIDTAAGWGFVPIQGTYSACLFGGPSDYFSPSLTPTYSTISQTGLIPTGTLSLLMDVSAMHGFTVTLGEQTLNMLPLQVFPSYTLYGADISSYAGRTAQLSITAPPTGSPNGVLLDNIGFSTNSVPEPSAFALFGLGALAFAIRRNYLRFSSHTAFRAASVPASMSGGSHRNC